MKTLNIWFEDEELEEMKRIKSLQGKVSWRVFILSLIKKEGKNENR